MKNQLKSAILALLLAIAAIPAIPAAAASRPDWVVLREHRLTHCFSDNELIFMLYSRTPGQTFAEYFGDIPVTEIRSLQGAGSFTRDDEIPPIPAHSSAAMFTAELPINCKQNVIDTVNALNRVNDVIVAEPNAYEGIGGGRLSCQTVPLGNNQFGCSVGSACNQVPCGCIAAPSAELCEDCGADKAWRTASVTSWYIDVTTTIERRSAKRDRSGALLEPCARSFRMTITQEHRPEPEPVGFEITLETNGGTVTPAAVRTDADGRLTQVLPVPARDGYLFSGWFTAAQVLGSGAVRVNLDATGRGRSGTVFTEDATLHAHWVTADRGIFTATFNTNGGEFHHPATTPTSVTTGAQGTLRAETVPSPIRGGYAFDGWWTAQEGGSRVFVNNFSLTEDTALWARWVRITVTFGGNGADHPNTTAQVGYDDNRLTELPTPTRAGFDFAGWYTRDVGGDPVTLDRVYMGLTTVFARWVSNIPGTFTITLDRNWGTGVLETTILATGTDGRLAAPPPPLSEQGFVGWSTERSNWMGNVTTDTVFTADTTIYAVVHRTPLEGY
jgi:uncharacterized repeat protein (TIGR02543 family)